MRYHFMPARMGMAAFRKWQVTSVGEPLERLCPLNTAGGNEKWLSHCRRVVPPRVINRVLQQFHFY